MNLRRKVKAVQLADLPKTGEYDDRQRRDDYPCTASDQLALVKDVLNHPQRFPITSPNRQSLVDWLMDLAEFAENPAQRIKAIHEIIVADGMNLREELAERDRAERGEIRAEEAEAKRIEEEKARAEQAARIAEAERRAKGMPDPETIAGIHRAMEAAAACLSSDRGGEPVDRG